MATDMFIKIGDIKGESQDNKHKDEIDVTSWKWGISQPGTMAIGGGGGKGRASFSDLTFYHKMDKASPNLMKICATGEHVDEAKLTVCKAGKDQQDYAIITMKKVFCTKIEPSGSNGEDELTEAVSLQFEEVAVEYSPQKGDGSLDAAISFNYNIKANKLG
ncbi:Hcp family type VI secretion system effector [Nitrosomonas communis]|uniref:Type VI secretion system secreted protein Hcp n=1 Tax=Nitrosomonas communis TaxID=44574 RepID=A0A1H2V2X9_9PROT|nr:type VI secretion system tube protein Hcp [Nitrosomonas communis]SDW62663.1 type VI secretion system secreted protein Hcp [Nitrosomonas communis]